MAQEINYKERMFKSINVGDILYDSWGYSMTLVSFYQVMAKKGTATVVLRELKNTILSGSFYGQCIAVKDDFDNEQLITKRVTKNGYINIDSQELKKWDGKSKYYNHLD